VWRRSILIVCGVKESRIVAAGGALGAGEETETDRKRAVVPTARSVRVLMLDLGEIVADGAILAG
jgi:hypothetical protein